MSYAIETVGLNHYYSKGTVQQVAAIQDINLKIEKGELFKVGKGIYSEKKYVPDIAMFVYKYPYVVVTMRSAFYFYGLTDVIPDKCDLATTRDATKIKDERVKQYFISDGFFEEGIETVDYKGLEALKKSHEFRQSE